ncbi:hypothetical protein [Sphingopyxis chilensis]
MASFLKIELTMGERKTSVLWLRARARSIAEMHRADVRVSSVAKLLHFGDRATPLTPGGPNPILRPHPTVRDRA